MGNAIGSTAFLLKFSVIYNPTYITLYIFEACVHKKATLVLPKYKLLRSNKKLRDVRNSFVWKYYKHVENLRGQSSFDFCLLVGQE